MVQEDVGQVSKIGGFAEVAGGAPVAWPL